MSEEKRANIRNSTAEFLIFTGQSGENSIEVRVADADIGTQCLGRIFRDDLDHATGRVSPEKRALRTLENLHSVNVVEIEEVGFG